MDINSCFSYFAKFIPHSVGKMVTVTEGFLHSCIVFKKCLKFID